jgi:SAM-dependent MidA family methyltransferase
LVRPPLDLPSPPDELAALSHELWTRIDRLVADEGPIPFSRYMRMALYEPGLGYYVNGLHKFGASGDFVTAPEEGPLFGQALAGWLDELAAELGPAWTLLELGPGSGALIRTLLESLERPPARVLLLEPSAALREVQRETLDGLPDAIRSRVTWIDTPPDPFDGAIIGNEVIDALPVERFRIDADGPRILGVDIDQGRPIDRAMPADERLRSALAAIEADLGRALPEGYVSEVCLDLAGWIETVSRPLRRGAVFLSDYGYPRREYYHPDRSGGTLVCQYRHRAHFDPYCWPGLNDLSSFVDFTAVADALAARRLTLTGFTTQGGFLLGSGTLERLEAIEDPAERARRTGEFKRLALPGEMGEKFKIIAAARDCTPPDTAFLIADHLGRL